MLQPVSLGHHRCICPGLSLDDRGIPLGQQLAILFPDLRAVTAFFATASAEISLERILASLEIVGTETPLGLKQWLVRFDVQDSLSADPFAQWARLHRGRVFTGTQSHFVPYRDQQALTGYDLIEPSSVVRGTTGLVIYAQAGIEERQLKTKESLYALALNLSLRPLNNREEQQAPTGHAAFLVPKALSAHFFKYLQRLQVAGEVLPVYATAKTVFNQPTDHFYLVRCQNVPRSLFLLMKDVPGVEVLHSLLDNVFVAWPYKHPFALDNLAPLFDDDKICVFSKSTDRAHLFQMFGQPTRLEHLTQLSLDEAQPFVDTPTTNEGSALEPVSVPIQLTKNYLAKPRAVDGVFIANEKITWLQEFLYRLPKSLLEESSALLTKAGIFILSPGGGSEWAMGDYFYAAGSDIYMPWGHRWNPPVASQYLREALGGPADDICFIRSDETVIRLPKTGFAPLSKAVLSPWVVEDLEITLLSQVREETTELVHEPQKRFVLWRGIQWDEPTKQLPETTAIEQKE